MSTPAIQALSSSAPSPGGAPGAGGAAPAPGAGGAPAPGAGGGAGGAPAQGFWSSWTAPEQKETRDWVANKAYESPFTLAKTARDLEREAATLRAGKGYPTPGPDGKVDPNADKAWRALTGVPETPDKYEIPLPENNPYPQFKTFMAEELHKAGVPAAMAPLLARGYESAVAKMETQLREAENVQSQEALLRLQSDWGSNYQERMSMAERGKNWLSQEAGGLDDLQLRTLEAVLTTPKFLTAMWKIGAGNAEARFAGGDHPAGFTGGASEAQNRWNQIQADRAAGKISNLQWADMTKSGGEIPTLIERIANGNAPQQ